MNAFFFSFFFVFGLLVNKVNKSLFSKKSSRPAAAGPSGNFPYFAFESQHTSKKTKHNAKRARVQCSSKQ